MAFNPFNEEKTKELTKTFRQQYQELIKRDKVEEDEEINLALRFIEGMNNQANYLDEMERYVQRQLNRYARVHCCGMEVDFPTTDRQAGSKRLKCGDHRICPYCRGTRIDELVSAIRHHHNGMPMGEFLKIKNIHENEYDMYSKKAQRAKTEDGKKVKYGKINQPNNRIIFFSMGDVSFGEDLIDYDNDEYNQVNWHEVLEEIPMGKNISGSIWIKPGAVGTEDEEGNGEEEEEVEKTMIAYPHFGTNATKREKNLAFHKAAAETEVVITTIEDLQRGLFAIDRIWRENIGKDKCQPFIDYMYVSELDIIAWNKAIVPRSHIENSNIDKVDNQSSKKPTKELTPTEQLALVK